MKENQISVQRLSCQGLAFGKFKLPADVLTWMGAMQAQDFNMAKLAVGLRMKDGEDTIVSQALEQGDIVRAHVLRPTWHFVSAKNIYWMNELCAGRIKKEMAYNDKVLELTEKVFTKALKIIEKNLESGEHLTRDALAEALQRNKILTSENRLAHLLLRAELEGIACSGSMKGKQQTYALLSQRVPKVNTLPREEAIAKLTNTYFQSRGPATVADYMWWSGLSPKEAREGLENIKEKLSFIHLNGQDYWMASFNRIEVSPLKKMMLIPAFDEYIISYKDRSASLLNEHTAKAITKNGIFYPVILLHGKAVGTWKRTNEKGKILLTPNFFARPNATTIKMLRQATLGLQKFWEKNVEVIPEATS